MANNDAFVEDIVSRLVPLGPVASRQMFGGFGVFLDGVMFALIAGEALYLKADDVNRPYFEAAGSEPFSYLRRNRPVHLSYWRVPVGVYDDGDALCRWAEGARAAAQRAKAARSPRLARRR